MSRRRGQDGSIENRNGKWSVRFWYDIPGQEERERLRHVLGPSAGPGKLTRSEAKRLAREYIASTGADSPEHLREVEAVNSGITFSEQAERWLDHMRNRKRKPISPKTASDWEYCLEKWLTPNLGRMLLAPINNGTMKELVKRMAAAGLSPKTIQNYVQVVKMVVASAVNEDGEQLYPRQWNHDFIDMPVVKNQKRPTFTSDEVTRLVAASEGKYRVLFALLAGTGMRIGEALALDVKDFHDNMLTVRKSAWQKVIKGTKTDSGDRDLDIHPLLTAMLREFIGDRTEGFIFGTVGKGKLRNQFSGKPDTQQNILGRVLHPTLQALGLEKRGEHAFRRFRVTWLRKQWRHGFPRDLEHYWIGHAPGKHVSDLYSMLKDDVEFRQEWVLKVGLNFELPGSKTAQLDPMDPQTKVENVAQVAA